MTKHTLHNDECSAGDVVCHETATTTISMRTDQSTGRATYRTRLLLETDAPVLKPDTAYVVTIREIVYADTEAAS